MKTQTNPVEKKIKDARAKARAYYKEIVNTTRKTGSYDLAKIYNLIKDLADKDLFVATYLETLLKNTADLQVDIKSQSFTPIRRYNPIRRNNK